MLPNSGMVQAAPQAPAMRAMLGSSTCRSLRAHQVGQTHLMPRSWACSTAGSSWWASGRSSCTTRQRYTRSQAPTRLHSQMVTPMSLVRSLAKAKVLGHSSTVSSATELRAAIYTPRMGHDYRRWPRWINCIWFTVEGLCAQQDILPMQAVQQRVKKQKVLLQPVVTWNGRDSRSLVCL